MDMEKTERKVSALHSDADVERIAERCLELYEAKQKVSFSLKKTQEGKVPVTGKKERKAEDWLCLQTLAQFLMVLTLALLVASTVVGCSVDIPERAVVWNYIPSSTLKADMSFVFHPEDTTVDIVKDAETLKSIGVGDSYAYMPYRYLISIVSSEDLVLVLNQTEELARFVRA